MKTETKETIKKAATYATSTAAGAVAGVMAGAAMAGQPTHAQEVEVEDTIAPPTADEPTANHHEQPAQNQAQAQTQSQTQAETPVQPETPAQTNTGNDEVEVIGYDRVTNEDGSQMDVAVVNVNGNEVGIIDLDLDNEADVIVCDLNHNGVIEENEMQVVHGEGLAMQPFQEAAGFDPLYAQNDMPDYVNDANVDTYMA